MAKKRQSMRTKRRGLNVLVILLLIGGTSAVLAVGTITAFYWWGTRQADDLGQLAQGPKKEPPADDAKKSEPPKPEPEPLPDSGKPDNDVGFKEPVTPKQEQAGELKTDPGAKSKRAVSKEEIQLLRSLLGTVWEGSENSQGADGLRIHLMPPRASPGKKPADLQSNDTLAAFFAQFGMPATIRHKGGQSSGTWWVKGSNQIEIAFGTGGAGKFVKIGPKGISQTPGSAGNCMFLGFVNGRTMNGTATESGKQWSWMANLQAN